MLIETVHLKEDKMKELWKVTIFLFERENNITELDWRLKTDLVILTSIRVPAFHKVKFYYFAIMSKVGKVREKIIQMALNLKKFLF